MTSSQKEIPEWVRKYVGLPSRECGRGPSHFDCYGLAQRAYEIEKGIHLPAYSNISEEFADAAQQQIEAEKGNWLEVAPGSEREMDLVLCYKTFRQGKGYILRPLHLGLVATPGLMLHAEGKIGACVEDYRDNPVWQKRVAGFFRHRNLALGGERGPADPFSRHEIVATEGTCIREILEELGMRGEVELDFTRVVFGDGRVARGEDWETPLRAGTRLQVSVIPRGQSGLRIGLQIGIIALAIVASYYGGPWAGLAVSTLGTLALNMFLPMPVHKPTKMDPASPAYSISGARNSLRPGSPVPTLFGKFRCTPPMAGWYTGSISNKRYFYGIYEISNGLITDPILRIGDTLIDKFTGVETILDRGWHPSQLIQKGGWNPKNNWPTAPQFGWTYRVTTVGAVPNGTRVFDIGDTITFNGLYPRTDARAWDVNQNKPRANWPGTIQEENIGAAIPYGTTGVTRTSNLGADELQVEIGLDQLGRITGQGEFDDHYAKFDILENPVEFPAARRVVASFTVTGKTQDAIFTGERWQVAYNSPSGQYDVTVRQLNPTESSGDSQYLNKSTWLNLKTIKHSDPVPVKGYARLFVKIKASGQLTGILDKLTAECQRIGPVWDKEKKEWEWKPSSSPATAYRLLLQAFPWAERLPDTSLALGPLQNWANFCATQKCEFNAYIDFLTSRDKLLSDICLMGYAAWTMEMGTGKMSVSIDPVDRPDPVPVRYFSSANSWNIRWTYTSEPPPDFIRVTIPNAKQGYAIETFEVYNDGKNVGNAETSREQQYLGETDKARAHLRARMEIANASVRRMIHTRTVGPEYLACEIGDVVGLADDSLAIGLGRSGRIEEIFLDGNGEISGCRLDQMIGMERGETYALAISGEDARVVRIVTDTRAGGTATVQFADTLPDTEAIRVDDTWTLGTSARTVVPVIVRDIRPDSRDGSAEVTFVPLPPQLATVGKDIPEYADFVTLPRALPAPIVDGIVSDATVMQSTLRGDLIARVVFRLRPISFTGYSVTVMYRLSNTDHEWTVAQASALSVGQIAVTGVGEGNTYDFVLFYESPTHFTSPSTNIRGHKVVGRSAAPLGLSNIQLSVQNGNTLHARWDSLTEADVRQGGGIFVRHAASTAGVTWATSLSLLSQPLAGTVTQTTLPFLPGTYLFRVRDSSGLWSPVSSEIVLDHNLQEFVNVSTLREDPGFVGTKQNLTVIDNTLRITATGFNAIPNVNAIPNFNRAGTTVQGMGIYTFENIIDLGSVKNIRIRRHMVGFNDLINDSFISRTGKLSTWESWSGVTSAPGDCWVEIAHTRLDPASNPWSTWTRLEVAELTTRYIRARALVFTTDATYTFVVDELGLTIDEI